METSTELVVTVDIGTSSVKALVYDARGRAVDGLLTRRPQELAAGSDGSAVMDPVAVRERVFACLDDLNAALLDRPTAASETVIGVGLCTFVSNLLGLDGAGKPTTPILTYADVRGAAQAEELKNRFDEAEIHQQTGVLFHPSYWPAQLGCLAGAEPETFRQTSLWITLGQYIELTLFGRTSLSYSAAAWTGLLDLTGLDYHRRLLDYLGLSRSNFTDLCDSNRPLTGLKDRYARRWPSLAKAAWFPALGDGAAANIGCGGVGPDRIALTMGATTAVRAVLDRLPERVPDGLWCYRVSADRPLLGGALTEGGELFSWFRKSLNLPGPDELERQLAALPPDGHGLTVLPFWSGERAPGWAGHARGVISGLTMAQDPVSLVRAAMEAVALRIGLVHQLLSPHLTADHQVIASGGALEASPTWLKIMADVLGRPILLPEISEATSRGVALVVLESLGLIDDLAASACVPGRIQAPDPDNHRLYDQAGRRQAALYDRLIKG